MNESILYNICMLVSTMVEVYLVFDFYKAFHAKTENFQKPRLGTRVDRNCHCTQYNCKSAKQQPAEFYCVMRIVFNSGFGFCARKYFASFISLAHCNCCLYECGDGVFLFIKSFG